MRSIAVLLAWVAGGVDAVGFMTLCHLFTAFMSGNSATLGVSLGTADGSQALLLAYAITVFMAGIAGGFVLQRQARIGPRLAIPLAFELALVIGFGLCGHLTRVNGQVPLDPLWRFYMIAALPLLAMGLQNAVLQKVGGASVHTTFVTGILMSFVESTVKCVYAWRGGGRFGVVWASRDAGHARLYASIWLGYLAGAVLAAWICQRHGFVALLPAAIGLLCAIAHDVLYPPSAIGSE